MRNELGEFLQLASSEEEEGDFVLDIFESNLKQGYFPEVDDCLNHIEVNKLAPSTILVILTITWHGKEHQKSRENFVRRAEAALVTKVGMERAGRLLETRR
jgi:hypothetical protein